MKRVYSWLRAVLVLSLTLPLSCATSLESTSGETARVPEPEPVQVTPLGDGQLRLSFAPLGPNPAWDALSPGEARELLATLLESLPEDAQFQVLPTSTSAGGAPSQWQLHLRAEFLARYGPPLLPLPASLERSPLFMALRLSPRYMGAGVRDAARELFRSPVFLASVTLSVLIYFSAWLIPEPLFSKAFAATLTARLALAVGVLELRNVALACLQLYREAQAARSMAEIEALAERFGRAMGGTALRVIVMVASFGLAKMLPNVPPGGLGPLLSPPRYALAGGLSLESASTAQMVADGTLVVAGTALGTATFTLGRACSDGATKKEGFQWHHLATDKNDISASRGGPWTPRFQDLFDKAGMSLEDEANLVYLSGHKGPHPAAYHTLILERLQQVIENCGTIQQCKQSLVAELRRIAKDVCSPGSRLHQLATQTRP